MILRRIITERYGCFGTAEFEFRRGMNLISGINESGKSLLLTALPAGLLGVEHGARLRSWGDSLSCRVTLLFEGADGGLRLTRDLESNLVRIEECDSAGAWRETLVGLVAPTGAAANWVDYLKILERRLSIGGEALLRVLLDAGHAETLLADDGRLAAALVSKVTEAAIGLKVAASTTAPAERQQEIAALEAELAVDRADYAKGEKYLTWIRKRWALDGEKPPSAPKKTAAKTAARGHSATERRRDELHAELKKHGIPVRLPDDLPALFAQAEGLRQELAALQLELTPLQRRRQGVRMPGLVWPMLVTLAGIVAAGAGYWLKTPWLLPLATGCGVVALLVWTFFLVSFSKARGERGRLDQELQGVEQKRAEALARQSELAEQFESCGLPSAPVEMVKLQQLCRRHEELIREYRDLCGQLGANADEAPAGERETDDGHLRPEELPDAQARLAELGESLRRREARLTALRNGTAPVNGPAAASTPSVWSEQELLQSIGQQMERLAGGHHHVRLRDGRLQLEAAPGKWAVPSSCSRGTVECLALAMRLALCQMTGGVLPLTVDDLPGLDTRRRQSVLRTLELYAVDHQLLLASSDDELAKRALRERWHAVSLDPKVTAHPAGKEEQADVGQLHLL